MSAIKKHLQIYKAIALILLVAFSLSPCSLKRDLLGIFDVQHISTLNKVKTTPLSFSGCQSINSSSRVSISKNDFKYKEKISPYFLESDNFQSEKKTFSLKNYSGYISGNSPPKYILFKRLKLDMI